VWAVVPPANAQAGKSSKGRPLRRGGLFFVPQLPATDHSCDGPFNPMKERIPAWFRTAGGASVTEGRMFNDE